MKWGVWAIRSPRSTAGYHAGWAKRSEGGRDEFDTHEAAEKVARRKNNERRTPLVTYFAKEIKDE